MKISCDIIKDLLPLYAEDMTSGDSRSLVEEHIASCECCRQYLKAEKEPLLIQAEVNIQSIKRIKKSIRKRRWVTACLTCFLVLTVLYGTFMYLNSPVYLTAGEAIESVSTDENGVIMKIVFTDDVAYHEESYEVYEESDGKQKRGVHIVTAKQRWDSLFGRNTDVVSRTLTIGYMDKVVHCSVRSGENDSLVWGENIEGGCTIAEPRLYLVYILGVALALGTILWLPAFIMRKKRSCAVLWCFGGYFWSLVLAVLIGNGGEFRTSGLNTLPILAGIAILSVLIWVTGCIAWRYKKLCQQDKAL